MRRKLYNNKCHLVQDRTMVVNDGKAEVSGVKKQTYGKDLVDLKRHVIDFWIFWTREDSPYGVMKDLKQTWTNTIKLQPVALLL